MKITTQLKRFNNFLNQFKNQHLLLKVGLVFSLLTSNFFYSKEISASFKNISFVVSESNSTNKRSTTNGGVSYGALCSRNTPILFSNIGAHCGATLLSISENIYCTTTQSATGYRFRVTNTTTNATQVLSTRINRFNFDQLAERSFGTTYLVAVAVRDTDGMTYLPYSKGCKITTPPFPTSRIRPIQCDETGYQVISNIENIVAVIISGASEYRFYLSNASLGYSSSIDLPTNKFYLNLFSGLVSEKTYSVQVAVKIGGNWGPYGAICKITTPGFSKTIQSLSNEFKAVAYPNPFAEDFKLNVKTALETTIQMRVYDMLGKQVENRNVEVSNIENLQIGSSYPSGVYNVVVSQGENTQTLRVIKR